MLSSATGGKMSSLSKDEISVLKVFRNRVSKTLRIEGISNLLEPSDSLFFTVSLDDNLYNLKIGIKDPMPFVYIAIDNHAGNKKRVVTFSVTFMDGDGRPFFKDDGTLYPSGPLMIASKHKPRDLPHGCLMVRFELSCISWIEKDAILKETRPFTRTENLSRDFGKLFSQHVNADVVIKVGKAEIPAHSQILSARSEVFAAMFEHDMSEKRNRTIEISDVGALAMHYFLQFIYTGILEEIKDMRQDILKQLYAAADKYAVFELKEMCSDFILSKFCLDNLALTAELAFRHNDKRMQEAVLDFISKNTATLDSAQWREFEDTVPDVAADVVKTFCEKNQTTFKGSPLSISSSRS